MKIGELGWIKNCSNAALLYASEIDVYCATLFIKRILETGQRFFNKLVIGKTVSLISVFLDSNTYLVFQKKYINGLIFTCFISTRRRR